MNRLTRTALQGLILLGTAAGDVRPLVDLVDLSERLDDVCVDLRELSPHPTLEALSAAARRLASFLAPGKEATHDATQRPDAPRRSAAGSAARHRLSCAMP